MSINICRRLLPDRAISLSMAPSPLLKRLYITRGITRDEQLCYSLKQLYHYDRMRGVDQAASLLSQAIVKKKRIVIIGDFDVDGATSTALAIKVLKSFHAHDPMYLIPNRFHFGYGLSPEIVAVAKQKHPDLLMTVDNGISSIEGVKEAKNAGIQVIITDHHLPNAQLPEANVIVNPNQLYCTFPSKHIAGVGVIFYVMCAVRAALEQQGWFDQRPKPNMSHFLDFVALGTIADLVPLDQNNRILVHHGLQRIRTHSTCIGIQALIEVARCQTQQLSTNDIAFFLAPRLNAAGRLEDMSYGVELLLATTLMHAQKLAYYLDQLNKERRHLEHRLYEEAVEQLHDISKKQHQVLPHGTCLYQKNWHQGIIGLLASRIKEKTSRPAIVFAPGDNGVLKGSGRSISGFHMKDALGAVAERHPGLVLAYGGHAMAAGLTIEAQNFEKFKYAFMCITQEKLTEEQCVATLTTDGALMDHEFTLKTAEELRCGGPWGQAFPEPLFDGIFNVVAQTLLKNKHLKLLLRQIEGNQEVDAILFNADTTKWPNHHIHTVHAVYQLNINAFRGQRHLQIIVRHLKYIDGVSQSC